MVDDDTPWTGLVLTPGLWYAGFIKRVTNHCYTLNINALSRTVSEKKIFKFSSCKSMETICFDGN